MQSAVYEMPRSGAGSTRPAEKPVPNSSLRDLRSKPFHERRELLSQIAGDRISTSTQKLVIDDEHKGLPAVAIRFVLSRTPLEQKYLAARFGLGLPRRMTAEALQISAGTAWAMERTLIVALQGLAHSRR